MRWPDAYIAQRVQLQLGQSRIPDAGNGLFLCGEVFLQPLHAAPLIALVIENRILVPDTWHFFNLLGSPVVTKD